jgi:nitroreductase
MPSMIETIQKRVSTRTFTNQAVAEEDKAKLKTFFAENCQGPFGNKVRFELVETTGDERRELKELGTYGIKGAHLFIAGAVKKNEYIMEDFGYCMERNILKATELGLGTCWLGGSLNRSAFARKIVATEDELIPAVTPLGYPAEKRSVMDNLARTIGGSKHRKEFGEIFFSGGHDKPLDKEVCGKYGVVLESVRLAPSASNKQPWRVIREKDDKKGFHFYLKENYLYNHIFKDIRLQNLDLGIALCHFEVATKELGLKGTWQVNPPQLNVADWKYIVSWVG